MQQPRLEPLAVPGVEGDLRVLRDWHSPTLGRRFDVTVLLPEGYDEQRTRTYPVAYFCDGHNLYDPAASAFGGVWHADRAFAGRDVIAVGVPCHPTQRLEEYSPHLVAAARERFPEARDARAADYLAFLTGELKPALDRLLRTRPVPATTAVIGSSAGGVLAAWAWARRPDVVGLAGVMSPALWLGGQPLLDDLARAARSGAKGRLAVDVGGREGTGAQARDVVTRTEDLVRLLRADDRLALRYEYDSQAGHDEAAWARRLPGVLDHLFGPRAGSED